MKLGKLSLVAVMALGTSAYAIDNVKVNGEVKVIYQTTDLELTQAEKDRGVETGLFKRGNTDQYVGVSPYNGASAGGVAATIGLTADLMKNISAGAEMQMYSSLGLEKNLFLDNMINAPVAETGFTNGTTVAGSSYADRTDDVANVTQMWLAGTFGKTTLKAGRMELDTPLLFTEKWNLGKNTFDAVVGVNTDLPDTTLVAAWVGKHNGHGSSCGCGALLAGSPGRTVDMNSFNTLGTDGAYALGAVNKSIADTTLQAWYYNVVKVADAVWLQADTKVAGMVTLGAQYAQMNPNATTSVSVPNVDDSKIWAVKAGVDVAAVNVYAAYSKADDDGLLGFANVSTADKTNIYTGQNSIYFDGVVTAPGAETVKVGGSTKVGDFNLAAAYVHVEDIMNDEVKGVDFSVSTKVGPVGLQAIYTNLQNDTRKYRAPTDSQKDSSNNPVYVGERANPFYMGRDIESIRLIASLKF